MLNNTGFDLWADDYDKSVGLSDEEDAYPFAGYRLTLNRIYQEVLKKGEGDVLDIGFGTAALTARLYQQGCRIFGQDFSSRMIALAQEKMPAALLCLGDFSLGLAEPLATRRYDAIIATYSLHHLTESQKVAFLRSLTPLLKEDGRIYIGDVAFPTRAALDACRAETGDDWDDDEIYFVYDELKAAFPQLTFEQTSHCAGLLTLAR